MAIVGTFKIEKDPFYQQGRREERAKARIAIAKAEQEKKEIIQQKDRELARQMLADKFPIDQIAKYTKLSAEEIKAL